jgi:chromosome segregation ATPase
VNTTTYGYIITVLSLLLAIAITYVGALLQQLRESQEEIFKNRRSLDGRLSAIMQKQAVINRKAQIIKHLNCRIEDLQESLRISDEQLKYERQDDLDFEELIRIKDQELAYNEKYMEAQSRVLELAQAEKNDLEKQLRLAKAETPQYLKACLLEKIHDAANLKSLNKLLEEANAGYAKDLAAANAELASLKEPRRDPDLDELDYIETRPELGEDAQHMIKGII